MVKLDADDHKLLARWAADCAQRVLPLFEGERPRDERPRLAIAAARAWARGEIRVGEARRAALAAHAAARACKGLAARQAARAAGHAAATAHVWTHAYGGAIYAVAAIERTSIGPARDVPSPERAWQEKRLPKRLRALVYRRAEK